MAGPARGQRHCAGRPSQSRQIPTQGQTAFLHDLPPFSRWAHPCQHDLRRCSPSQAVATRTDSFDEAILTTPCPGKGADPTVIHISNSGRSCQCQPDERALNALPRPVASIGLSCTGGAYHRHPVKARRPMRPTARCEHACRPWVIPWHASARPKVQCLQPGNRLPT